MSPADQISLYFSSMKIFRFFCQKEEDLPLLFHKMLEGLHVRLHISTVSSLLTYTEAADTIESQAEGVASRLRLSLLKPLRSLRSYSDCHRSDMVHHLTTQPLFQFRPGRLRGNGHLTYARAILDVCARRQLYVD